MLDRVDRMLSCALAASERLAILAVRAGGIALILATLMVSLDVLLRRIFSVTLGGADEISSYAFAVSMSWGLTLALIKRAHIRVDFLYGFFSGRARALLDISAAATLAALGGILTYWAAFTSIESFRFGATSNSAIVLPLWIPQGLWTLGFAFFFVVSVLITLKCITAFIGNNLAALHDTFGIISFQEGAENEIQDVVRSM